MIKNFEILTSCELNGIMNSELAKRIMSQTLTKFSVCEILFTSFELCLWNDFGLVVGGSSLCSLKADYDENCSILRSYIEVNYASWFYSFMF